MQVLLINGSPHKEGTTFTALKEVEGRLKSQGIGSEILWIGRSVPGCIACGACKGKGKCFAYDDIVNEVIARAPEFDGFVFGSPVYYGGIAGDMKCFMDRLFYTGRHFEYKVGAVICALRRSGGVATFQQMNSYLNLARMLIAPSRYWLAVHGNNGGELQSDKEGLQTLRETADGIAYLLKLKERAGLPTPAAEEPREGTNFIR
ncbi:MAG: flavodoxin family protein [Christensenellaceae bacterium]|jgi:multimeric flavodoxin WrbA|nr:flavodoxin family protein [Christensenellaceae bacterium]